MGRPWPRCAHSAACLGPAEGPAGGARLETRFRRLTSDSCSSSHLMDFTKPHVFRQEPPFLGKLKRRIPICVLRTCGPLLQMVLYCPLFLLSVMTLKTDDPGFPARASRASRWLHTCGSQGAASLLPLESRDLPTGLCGSGLGAGGGELPLLSFAEGIDTDAPISAASSEGSLWGECGVLLPLKVVGFWPPVIKMWLLA